MHLLRCEDNFFSSYLSPWVLEHQASSLYQDTTVYCKDIIIKTNRLVMGLIFPELGGWEGFNLNTRVEMILPEWEGLEVQEAIIKLFGGQDEAYEDETNSDSKTKTRQYMKHEMILTVEDEEDSDEKNYPTVLNGDGDDLKLQEQQGTNESRIQNSFECTICTTSFTSLSHLKKHNLEVHEIEDVYIFKCELCAWKGTSIKSLQRHEQTRTVSCNTCSQSFPGMGRLKRHEMSHSEALPVKCDICNKSLKSEYYLTRHKRIKHMKVTGERYICEICSTEMKTKEYLYKHKKKVHTSRSFMCSFCEKLFKTKSNLKDHETIHGDNHSTECTICGFMMRNNKKSIKSHMQTHYKAGSLKCDKCEFHFRSQSYLIEHDIRNHKSE